MSREVQKRIAACLKKYRYAALVLLLGIGLLLLPMGAKPEPEEQPPPERDDETYVRELESRLCDLLSKVEGAGEVEVLLSLKNGSRTEYHTDTERTDSSQEEKTVILSAGSAYDEAAVSTVYYPQFQGAVIVCRGADRATVRLNIIQAVSSATGLRAEQITVVKMK